MEEYRIRVRIFVGIILTVLSILGLRLAQLQLVDWQGYSGESRSNAVRELRVQPARGAIFDRNGKIMVDNAPTYTITLKPRYFDESKIGLFADLLEVPDSVVVQKLEEARAWSAFRPSRSFREVPFDIYSRVQEHHYLLPGVDFEIDQKRRYLTRAKASHALGYIREIADAELGNRRDDGYRQGDLIGKTGLEKNYEAYLRGQMGSEFKLVNIRGLAFKSFREGLEDTPPVSGYDMHLTIDHRVQALAESLFVNKRGAAVAIDPKTGGIVALVSKPDYDPEIFTESVDAKTWDYLNNSPEKPLLNRATMNLLPPGSTWKPFMALMSLAAGNIKPGEKVVCRGGHPLGGGRFFTCMGVHGALDVEGAIQNSCNTFFFEMMYRASIGTFDKYAHLFGFGERAPLEIDEQTAGLIPDSSYFRRLLKQQTGRDIYPPPPGWTLSLGIGQGNMGVTPMQLARYVAAVANGGQLHAPHLVHRLTNRETGETVWPALPAPREIPIEDRYFSMVHEGMKRVMERGTGVASQIPGILSGGKTGTAQAPGGMKDHSLFIMFAPFEDPQIALAVMCENSGYGGSCAAPIASLMAELYLKGEIPDTPQKQIRMQRALLAQSQPLPPRKPSSK